NSRDAETARVAAAAGVRTIVLTPSCNLGTAGGLAAGLRAFLALPHATHAWILDDDAVATRGALEAMLAAMGTAAADAAMPSLAVCRHLPPESGGARFDAKLYSALQNGSYVAVRLRTGGRALRHLPGLSFRYLRHYRWRPRAWLDVATACWNGAVLGYPASS